MEDTPGTDCCTIGVCHNLQNLRSIVPCAGHAVKRRRTESEVEAERSAREEKKAAKEAALAAQRAAAANGGAFRLKAVQPWADKEGKLEELTEEQKEYLAKVEAEKKAKEAEKLKTEAVRFLSRLYRKSPHIASVPAFLVGTHTHLI
jgi:hypothetical protein